MASAFRTHNRIHQLMAHSTAGDTNETAVAPNLTAAASRQTSDNLIVRELEAGDYERGFIKLLGQLTTVGDVSREAFLKRFNELKRVNDTYKIAVIIDPIADKVIASATLVVEKKFVHGCGAVGHVEDVVVDSTYRGRSLGLRVVDQLKTWAEQAGCYKIILDCAAHNVPFYNKLGFVKKEEQMAFYYNKH